MPYWTRVAMAMRRVLLLLCLIVVIVAAGKYMIRRPSPATPSSPVASRPPYDQTLTHRTIAFWAGRARNDPQGAIEYATLAGWYLKSCRDTGDIADALRAEQAARRSLAIRTWNNYAAYDVLAQSLLTQHRFKEAEAVADRAFGRRPDDPEARRMCIEIRLELGDYKAADTLLRQGPQAAEDASVQTLRARMLTLRGRSDLALRLLLQAQAAADRDYDMSCENVAWYHVRVGDLLATMGRADEAERSYREALAIFPRDYKAMYGLAQLAADRHRWQEAISWGQQSAEIVPMPQTLALVGDAYAASNNPQEAERQYRVVDAIGKLSRAQGVIYDRQRALFCADHNRNLDEAVMLARRELQARHDIYAYDTYAWACYQEAQASGRAYTSLTIGSSAAGMLAEADKNARQALSLGTRDASLYFHAGMIAAGRGDKPTARTYLQRALAINPLFHPFQPQQARDMLARLKAGF